MPIDTDAWDGNQPRPEVPVSLPDVPRSTRPLGRGLEDVSHLFLSNLPAPRERELKDERESPRVQGQPRTRTGVAVLRPGEPLTRDQLIATLAECQVALEHTLRVMDVRVPCVPFGEIDVLAADAADRLTVIDVDVVPGDGLLARGIGHLDWIVRNSSNLRRMFERWTISPRPPRLVLVAPAFSQALRSAVHHITGPEIACVRYQGVQVSSGPGIVFERVGHAGE
jgi:hypothetical protein